MTKSASQYHPQWRSLHFTAAGGLPARLHAACLSQSLWAKPYMDDVLPATGSQSTFVSGNKQILKCGREMRLHTHLHLSLRNPLFEMILLFHNINGRTSRVVATNSGNDGQRWSNGNVASRSRPSGKYSSSDKLFMLLSTSDRLVRAVHFPEFRVSRMKQSWHCRASVFLRATSSCFACQWAISSTSLVRIVPVRSALCTFAKHRSAQVIESKNLVDFGRLQLSRPAVSSYISRKRSQRGFLGVELCCSWWAEVPGGGIIVYCLSSFISGFLPPESQTMTFRAKCDAEAVELQLPGTITAGWSVSSLFCFR